MLFAKWGKGIRRLSCEGYCGSEREEQKRMHMVIKLVCLEQKVLHSAKHAVPLRRTIITVYQDRTILTKTIKQTIHLYRDSLYQEIKEYG